MNRLENIEKMKEIIKRMSKEESFYYIRDNIPEYTMYGYMLECNKNNMSSKALRFGNRRLSYQEFDDAIGRYAKGFLAMGITKGSRVALLLPNLPESTIIIYALNKIGAISDNIDPTSKSDRIRHFLETEGINAIVCFDAVFENTIKPNLNYIRGELHIDKILVPTIKDSLGLVTGALYSLTNKANQIEKEYLTESGKIELISIRDFLSNCRYTLSYTTPYIKGEIASICHSSGTTGIPKIIPSTNENINFITFQHQLLDDDFSNVKTMLHFLPGFAKFGFSDVMHMGHCLGLELIEQPIFTLELTINMILKYKINAVFSLPALWVKLVEDTKYSNIDLSFLYEAVYGGGELRPSIVAKINKFFVTHGARCLLRVGYGLSELDGTCILEDPFRSSKGSCGTDLIGGMGKIINPETGKEVPNGEPGELWFTKGSFPVTEFDGKTILKTGKIDEETYLRTGDYMIKNNDGEYFFYGRMSNDISRYDGYKVKPAAVEPIIASSPYVKDVMLTEYHDNDRYGEMPLAFIVLEDNIDESYEKIIDDIINRIVNAPRISFRDIPGKLKLVDSIPMTPAMKKDYRKAKEIGVTGEEITILTKETNMGLEGYDIIYPEKVKIKTIKK